VITGEPTVGEPTDGELTVEEPAANELDLIRYQDSTTRFLSDNGQGVLSDDYAQDVFPQVLPAPPSCIPLLPSDFPNKIRMAVTRNKTIQALGSKCFPSQVSQIDLATVDGYTKVADYVPTKVDGQAQDFHCLKIFYATKSIALSYFVDGMLTPFPFDRGKMSSSLSSPCHHAGSFANPIKSLLSKLGAFIPTHIKSIGMLLVSCDPLLPMGSDKMHKLHHAQVLAWKSEHLHPDPTWMWITQESHVLFPTSSNHLIWKYACF